MSTTLVTWLYLEMGVDEGFSVVVLGVDRIIFLQMDGMRGGKGSDFLFGKDRSGDMRDSVDIWGKDIGMWLIGRTLRDNGVIIK